MPRPASNRMHLAPLHHESAPCLPEDLCRVVLRFSFSRTDKFLSSRSPRLRRALRQSRSHPAWTPTQQPWQVRNQPHPSTAPPIRSRKTSTLPPRCSQFSRSPRLPPTQELSGPSPRWLRTLLQPSLHVARITPKPTLLRRILSSVGGSAMQEDFSAPSTRAALGRM